MTCKHEVPAQTISGARSVIPQGCCPPDDTTPPVDEDGGPPGTEVDNGGGIPGLDETPVPQPNPQPDPPARIYRKRSSQRRNQAQRFPTPSNRWRWKASVIDGTPPTGPGPQSSGGTLGGGLNGPIFRPPTEEPL